MVGAESALQAPAVIGLGKNCVVIKFHGSEHMAGAARIVRQCICERYPAGSLKIHLPQLYCPACVLWEVIRRRARTGGKLLPGAPRPGFADRLRSLARRLGWERAERLGLHIARRGATRAILEAGGSSAQLLKADQTRRRQTFDTRQAISEAGTTTRHRQTCVHFSVPWCGVVYVGVVLIIGAGRCHFHFPFFSLRIGEGHFHFGFPFSALRPWDAISIFPMPPKTTFIPI